MRLWSLHPQYLDTKGLLAFWREALLAQKVLQGKTKGYRNHPQLIRFKNTRDPLKAIGSLLLEVWREADRRGYQFTKDKIVKPQATRSKILVTKGQIDYERAHLLRKLKVRDPNCYKELLHIAVPQTNPLFRKTPGPVASWEKPFTPRR